MNTSDWLNLAIRYGGFMDMDRVFLTNRLEQTKSEQEKIALIMPPASVMNAYFAEIYQKQSAAEACDYFFSLSKALGNFNTSPEFLDEGSEDHPNFRFIRLNLDGKAYGFCYANTDEKGIIFPEKGDMTDVYPQIKSQLEELFPMYKVSLDKGLVYLEK
jgi:hypothetical protein